MAIRHTETFHGTSQHGVRGYFIRRVGVAAISYAAHDRPGDMSALSAISGIVHINTTGMGVDFDRIGVRPTLWIDNPSG